MPEFGAHHDESRIARRLGWDRVWGALDTRSAARYRDIEAESGVAFFSECGALALVAGSMRCRTDAMLRASEDAGVAVERMSGADLREEFPGLEPPPLAGGVEGLLERKSAGHLSPRQLVKAQLDLARRPGRGFGAEPWPPWAETAGARPGRWGRRVRTSPVSGPRRW
ncbi:FAD-dependent oxidoreductase [Streptomyces sp. CB03234]|uniref:FAD-dependent oxidoreductase n=1 Tax=Streptomyces sp. (strain CB03234) TaxID=1703937 RepID=UPI003FD6B7F5